MSEAIASAPLEATLPLAEAPAPTELGARRALNAEYLRHHPDEVARFLDERVPSCLLYTSPSPRDRQKSRMPSSA